MKTIGAIVLSVVLLIGLTTEGHAATSGVYKCYAFQGSPDGVNLTWLAVQHYNPNNAIQHITRIRVWDSLGSVLLDQSYAIGAFSVGAHGSQVVFSDISGFPEGLQIMVNWRQAVDAPPPIPRLNLFEENGTIGTSSVSQSNCP